MFQAPSLLPALSVVENVELPLLLKDGEVTAARAAAMNALHRLELDALAERMPEELSGGQAQRVALARALASGARLLLADGQPASSTARQVVDALLESIKDTSTALLVATHDSAVSARMAGLWRTDHGVLLDSVPC